MMDETVSIVSEPPLEPKYAAEIALVRERMGSDFWKKIDRVEEELEKWPQLDPPMQHLLTDGGYTRSIFMEKGSLFTSRIHLTEHTFVISAGVVTVFSDEGAETLRASHIGITKPGTRRVLLIHEDCIWTTFHPNPDNIQNPDEIIMKITFNGGKYNRLCAASDMKRIAPASLP